MTDRDLMVEIFGPDEAHEKRVQTHLEAERAKREARRLLDAEERPAITAPPLLTLRERLARPRVRTPYRVHGLQHQGGNVMLVAAFKAGKTTVRNGLAKSLVDGDLFLGTFDVAPVAGNVAILDFELSESMLDDWLADTGIANDDRIIAESMRGKAASFNLLDDTIRAQWAAWLKARGVAYLMVDCLRPILDALNLDENNDTGRFLVALDALKLDAGIPEAAVVHHMGHAGERSRGDSRLRDWPDAEWRLVRQTEDPASPRFFSAYGRDVDVPECQLLYDPQTRRVSVAGGTRQDAKKQAGLDVVLRVLSSTSEWLSQRAIETACEQAGTEHARATIRSATKHGIQIGKIATKSGDRRAILHQCASAPQCAAKTPAQYCASAPPPNKVAHSAHSDFHFDADPFGVKAPGMA